MGQYVYAPFNGFNQLHRDLGRFFDPTDTATNYQQGRFPSQEEWSPEVDIVETPDGYRLLVDIPGVDPADVDITIEKNVLSISGSRTSSSLTDEAAYKRRERVSGAFLRQFTLSEFANCEDISAKSSHGVLEIIIPKHADKSPVNIKIET
tara:strand:+ start:272 stop:721 length:450 start_codon:yes stop_codon:yes gene_type:complete